MNISHDAFFLPPPPTPINGLLPECFPNPNPNPDPNPGTSVSNKRKRNSSRELDAETEVVALSPKSLMATYRFICEICNKGFQRDQNLQLHRRGHNLPWKLKQRAAGEQVKKKVYLCPEVSCVHHNPSRALGDLTGIKKHFSRKHGDKKWKCQKCPKKYAVMSDLKAHAKICGTREYKCDCGTIFSRKDSFITHRAFCDALKEEKMRNINSNITSSSHNPNSRLDLINGSLMAAPHQSAASGFFPFPPSHRLDFVGFEPSSSKGSNSMGADGLMNKPRLPLWLDQNQLIPDSLASSTPEGFLASSSSGNGTPSRLLPAIGHHTMLLKEEEDMNRPSYFRPESLSSLYSSPPSFSSSSSPSSMSATALLQKAAQMGSARSDIDNNHGMYTTGFNDIGGINLHQRHLFRQQMNDQLVVDQQGYATRNDHLAAMGSVLRGNGYESGSRQQGHNNTSSTTTGAGMRDFLGSLGGGGGGEGNSNGGEQGERRAILQAEEMTYTKFATMDDHHQEPYMDFMR